MVGELPLASCMQESKMPDMLMKWLCLVLSALVFDSSYIGAGRRFSKLQKGFLPCR